MTAPAGTRSWAGRFYSTSTFRALARSKVEGGGPRGRMEG